MIKVKKEFNVYWHKFEWEAEATLKAYEFKPSDSEHDTYQFIGTKTVEFDVPEFDIKTFNLSSVDALKAQKTEVLAEAQVRANKIDEKINKLLAIEFDG